MAFHTDCGTILVGHLALSADLLGQQVPWSLLQRWLANDERERLQELRQSADRWRMLAGRAVMRHCLRAYYGIAFARFTYGQHNKPLLMQAKNTSVDWAGPIDANLTHDGHHIIAAFCASGDVGVDVANLDDFTVWADFAEDYLGAEEIALVQSAPKKEQPLLALRFWTIKEAILKSTGHGLNVDPREIVLAPDAPCRIVRLPPDLPPVSAFNLHEWQISALSRASLAYVQRATKSGSRSKVSPLPALQFIVIPEQLLMPIHT